MYLLETAIKTPANRGNYIPFNELPLFISRNTGKQIYTSYFAHPSGNKDNHKAFRIALDYEDPDLHHDDPDASCRKVLPLVAKHYKQIVTDLKVQPWVWATGGGGFHLEIPNIFKGEPSPVLPGILKYNVTHTLFGGDTPSMVDLSPMMRRGTFRAPYSFHQGTRRFKVHVPEEMLLGLDYEPIRQLTVQLPEEQVLPPYEEWIKMEGTFALIYPTLEQLKPFDASGGEVWTIAQPTTCIQKILQSPPKKGQRHTTVMVLASMFAWTGTGYIATCQSIMDWLKPTLRSEEEAQDFMKSIYDVFFVKQYQFSCGHEWVQKSGGCIQYSRCPSRGLREFNVKSASIEEGIQELIQKKEWREQGKYLDMAPILGLEEPYEIFPGEIAVVAAASGNNKSTLVDNMLIRNAQHKSMKVNTEIVPWTQTQRLIQTAYGLSEKEVEDRAEEFLNGKDLDRLAHIDLVHGEIETYQELIQFINRKNPFVVVIDVLENVNTREGDMNKRIREAVLALAANAKEYNRIIFLVHHIRKRQVRIDNKGKTLLQTQLTQEDLSWDRSVVTKSQHIFVLEPDNDNVDPKENFRVVRSLKGTTRQPFETVIGIDWRTMRII